MTLFFTTTGVSPGDLLVFSPLSFAMFVSPLLAAVLTSVCSLSNSSFLDVSSVSFSFFADRGVFKISSPASESFFSFGVLVASDVPPPEVWVKINVFFVNILDCIFVILSEFFSVLNFD
eukprot:TRINITY_DN5717_c0_g1_i1.p5 TRINITY_DN5717_c0_g1~~TRINITY_DN5717_c0_g1_i1.p5  ORF type:complete len:119 (-),score=13.35 TRINITY_DN5717_c0_g1_i1:1223-1579(-)